VKNLKFGVLLCGALGVVSLLMSHWMLMFEFDKVQALLMMAGFAVPVVMAIMGITKPPFQKWQAAVSLAGFALIFIKSRMWVILPHVGIWAKDPAALMAVIGCIGGVIVSIMALVKSEEA